MAEQKTPGFLEQLQLKNRLEQVTGGPPEKSKVEQAVVGEQGEAEGKTTFQKTLQRMQEIANKIIADEAEQAKIAKRKAAEQQSAVSDQVQYDSVLAMINRSLAAGGRVDAVTPQPAAADQDNIKVSPANQAFLEGRGQIK
ncbi:MAG: hypothetical protein RI947_387 [Candidatus Parcubacteria bacterium]|jgi:hypothetical protein